jgi:hypothetical protein
MSYYDTWELPPAGIDKIEVRVHPALIARFDAFHRQGNINAYVQLRQPRYSIYYYIEFHAEYFNPYLNIFAQMSDFIVNLMRQGILKSLICTERISVEQFVDQYFTKMFSISEIEFFFDFKEQDMYLNPNNLFYERWHGATAYSSDFKDGDLSSLCAYERMQSLRADNHLAPQMINSIQYPKRIEFRLKQRTCDYLHPDNLRGGYETVFELYRCVLAKKWLDFGGQVVSVCNSRQPYAVHFQKIIELLCLPHIPNPGRFLEKTPPNPIPNQSAKRKGADREFFARFVTENECEHGI